MADFILIATVILFAYFGAKKGFIKSLLGLLSTMISTVITFLIYRPVSQLLYYSSVGEAVKEFIRTVIHDRIGEGAQSAVLETTVETGAMLGTSVIAFVMVIIVSKFIVTAVIRVVNLTSRLPVIREANSLFGFIAGALGGILVSYIAIGIIAELNAEGSISVMQESLTNSYIAVKLYNDNMLTSILSEII